MYFAIFAVFEYINSVNMTSASWSSIVSYGLRLDVFLFFALSPILVWGLNREIYNFVGQKFWYMGIIMGFLEFASYMIAGIIFSKSLPSGRESIAFLLMLVALVIGHEN